MCTMFFVSSSKARTLKTMFPTRWDEIMRGLSVTVQCCFLESPADMACACLLDISARLAVLHIIWRLWPEWIWKLICWERWYSIKFAFLLQRALGLRTALTDRLLLLLSLSANAAPYGIFLSLLQRMQGEKPQAKASSTPPKNVGMNMKIKAAILTQVKPCTL